VEHSTPWPDAPAHRRKFALIWVDFLVIAAAVLAFAAIVIANSPPIRSSTGTSLRAPHDNVQASELPEDPGLVRARIRLANGGPWS
jgi:hypothetical protein